MSLNKIRWGIISTAKIAETAFIPAVRQTRRGEVVGIASRNRQNAESFAAENGIPKVYDDYISLLSSGEIDAVYNPLPNTMHREWTEVAAANKKHIFCEKPLATTVADVEAMVKICDEANVVFFEAFVFLYHPQTTRLRELVRAGTIGELLQLHAHMSFTLQRPTDNIRMNQALGGGSLYDVGSYPITFARCIFGEEPVAIQSKCLIDPEYGVDTRATVILEFSGNRTASIQSGFDSFAGQGAALFGTEAAIDIPTPYHPQEKSNFVIRTRDAEKIISFENGVPPFTPAIEHFHDCIIDGAKPLYNASNAAGTLNVIETILSDTLMELNS